MGRTDVQVTPIGLGGAWLGWPEQGYDENLAVSTVVRALQLGIRLIDTSPAYIHGQSERAIGIALEQWYQAGGRREDIVLSTKTGTRTRPKDYSADGTRRSIEQSLRLLKTDYLDVVLVHDADDLEPVLATGGALEALQQMKGAGTIRAIGLGVRQHELHRRCIETGQFDVCLTYRDYNLVRRTAAEDILPLAEQRGVGIFNATSIIKGLLGGRNPLEVAHQGVMATRPSDTATYRYRPDEVRLASRLWQWAEGKGFGLLALNLQFCLRERRITSTLVGASEPQQIEADVQAVCRTIPEEAWEELQERFGLP